MIHCSAYRLELCEFERLFRTHRPLYSYWLPAVQTCFRVEHRGYTWGKPKARLNNEVATLSRQYHLHFVGLDEYDVSPYSSSQRSHAPFSNQPSKLFPFYLFHAPQ